MVSPTKKQLRVAGDGSGTQVAGNE